MKRHILTKHPLHDRKPNEFFQNRAACFKKLLRQWKNDWFSITLRRGIDGLKALVSLTKGIRFIFYIVTPNESSFENVEDVPPYVQQATPFFMGLMVVELVVSLLKDGTPLACVSDVVTSVSAGIISRMPTRRFEITTYIYMWNNFYVLELPWDSAWAWWLAFLVVDFAYYWVHRFAHGMAISLG
ncbi:alkylglycerol monooxygenase-like [Oncorhynchus nerka]|uniref:alkylglycerol monooxygenase-like n=1 Tax=Oncorhynchus nerka TaxID=8023 RepID=UPI0031B7FA7E